MVYEHIADLVRAYLETLRGSPCYRTRKHTASEWILTLPRTPTRKDVLARHLAKGRGHYQPGSCQANMELGLLRAACRWGLYQECWEGGDPTAGIRKWKRPLRKRTGKHEELRRLLAHFDQAQTEEEIRWRAIFGLMVCTGCRQTEARCAKVEAITMYGEMGAWIKGKTKTGEDQELPLPKQLMPWLADWKAVRTTERPNPYLFPSHDYEQPISSELVRLRWSELRVRLGIQGLWNYDLRRTFATSMSNELGYDDSTIRAILNHHDTSALSHYRHKSFDSLTAPIQAYADWLWKLKQVPKEGALAPVPIRKQQAGSLPVLPPPTPRAPAPRSIPVRPPVAVTVARASTRHVPGLTERECTLLEWYALGTRSPKVIAAQMGISYKTVQSFRERIMGKLNLESTAELVRYAMEQRANVTIPAPAIVSQAIPVSIEREEWPG